MKLIICGDMSITNGSYRAFDEIDTKTAFNDVLDVFAQGDRVIVNLECALTESENKIPKKGPNLKGPKNSADTLKAAGVTDCALSNNHIYDFGREGLKDTLEQLEMKQQHLRSCITDRKIKYNYHDAQVSRIEAVFARGNRTLSRALALACEEGVQFDAWDECFDYDRWMDIFERTGIDASFFANRRIGIDEVLPWDIIDCGVSKEYLKKERERAYARVTTPSCAEKCNGCGANKLGGKNKWCK